MGKSKKRIRRNRQRRKKLKNEQQPKKGFTAYERYLIHERDNETCQFPNCNQRTNLEVHHILPKSYCSEVLHWHRHQINDLQNGVLICRRHHIFLHKNHTWRLYIKTFKSLITRCVYN